MRCFGPPTPLQSSLLLTGVGPGGGAGFTGALDAFSADLNGLWSPAQRLLTSYTGPLLRVRRSGDDAEQDISAAAGGGVDGAAFSSFVGAGTGYVVTVYDQSGTNDLITASDVNQPILSLTVTAWDDTPAMVFDGNNPSLMAFESAISPLSLLLGAHSTANGTGTLGRYCCNTDGNSSFFELGITSAYARYNNTDGQLVTSFANASIGHGLEMWYNGASSISRIDTAEEAAAASQQLTSVSHIGAYFNGSQAMFGSIPYIVAFDAFYGSTDRAAVRAALASVFPFAV